MVYRKLKDAGLDAEELLTVYKGYIRPVLEYAAPVWNAGLTQKQVNHLEKIQKHVCHYILSNDYTTYHNALSILQLDSLQSRRIKLCHQFAEKASKDFRGGSLRL